MCIKGFKEGQAYSSLHECIAINIIQTQCCAAFGILVTRKRSAYHADGCARDTFLDLQAAKQAKKRVNEVSLSTGSSL